MGNSKKKISKITSGKKPKSVISGIGVKGEYKVYIVRKYVSALNIEDALKREKKVEATDVYLEDNFSKNIGYKI